jgi:hypothetical protein
LGRPTPNAGHWCRTGVAVDVVSLGITGSFLLGSRNAELVKANEDIE